MSTKGPYKRKAYQSPEARKTLVAIEVMENQRPVGSIGELKPDITWNVKFPEHTTHIRIIARAGAYRSVVECLPARFSSIVLGTKNMDNKMILRVLL